MDENKEPVRGLLLAPYMEEVIGTLKADKKLPAVRTYTATKNSFVKFCDEKELPTQTEEVFTAGRLKEYELWLRGRDAEWNTVSTYMRTLKIENKVFQRVEHFVPTSKTDSFTP